jgi:AbrB family transcriptional regulator, transcriptional pleiotropic regulator of transition state genes
VIVLRGSPQRELAHVDATRKASRPIPKAAVLDERGVVQTGIVRHIDELGRIVIPIEIRKRFGLGEKDPIEISVKGETIMLSRPVETCVFCSRGGPLEEHRGRSICRLCIGELVAREA